MIADGLIVTVLFAFVILGLFRGFFRSITGVLGWLLSGAITLFALPFLYPLLSYYLGDSLWIFIGSACVLFFLSLLGVFFLGDMLVSAVRSGPLKVLDNFLGCLFGFAKGVLIICFVYGVFMHFHKSPDLPAIFDGSHLQPMVASTTASIQSSIGHAIESGQLEEFFKDQFAFLEGILAQHDENPIVQHSTEAFH